MTDDDALRDAMVQAFWDTSPLSYIESQDAADAVIAALSLKANADPIGLRDGLFISGWIE